MTSLKINRLLPLATINMHMKFEIEIPKQTWLMLRKPCRLQTDGRTDGQTDKVNPVYPPSNFVGRGYKNFNYWEATENVNICLEFFFPLKKLCMKTVMYNTPKSPTCTHPTVLHCKKSQSSGVSFVGNFATRWRKKPITSMFRAIVGQLCSDKDLELKEWYSIRYTPNWFIHRSPWSTLFQVMACYMFSTKPLSESIMTVYWIFRNKV